jgi:hypothetical protein
MTLASLRNVLVRARTAIVSATTIVLFSSSALAQARAFSGPYVGAEAGAQQVIGGSLVNGVDTLQEDSRLVMSAFGGLRGQFGGFVVGGELGIGRTDGDLRLDEPANLLTIDYQNKAQWHWLLSAGHTIGQRTLVFAYLSEVSRSFDVTILQGANRIEQQDEQGLLRFGVGIEQRLPGPFRLRATVGTSRADFGDRQTNIQVGKQIEAAIGMVVQF